MDLHARKQNALFDVTFAIDPYSRRNDAVLNVGTIDLSVIGHDVSSRDGLPYLRFADGDAESYDLVTYFREKIIQGPGAFVEIANDYGDFARAFLRKLRHELTPLVSQDNAAPPARVQETHAPRLNDH